MVIDPKIFRDYDIRAIVPDQLDEDGLKKIIRAIIYYFKPKSVQIGRDMRVTSPKFHAAACTEFIENGVNVVNLGLTSTDMVYFAAANFNEDLAINISASHNPPEYNGMKIVKQGAIAVSGESGIYKIRDLSISNKPLNLKIKRKGIMTSRNVIDKYTEKVLSFIDKTKLKTIKIVSDAGNGMAGYYMPHIEKKVPWKVTRLYYDLDGSFPNHPASPSEEKNRKDCIDKVKELKADLGLVFDGDGDRVFMIDEKGRTLSGSIMTAIIAENLLQKNKGATILYNAVVGRIVPEVIRKNGGIPLRVRVGHAQIKEDMRKNDGLFCGENSGHYYFKDFYYADSAIMAALLVIELMSIKNKKLSELFDEYDKYPNTDQLGEVNFIVDDKNAVLKTIKKEYSPLAESIDFLDGISVWFKDWWFNIRPSNTEPLLRLNLEADNKIIFQKKLILLKNKIKSLGGEVKE